MSGPITRARLLELFDRLNEKLKQADEQGEVYIVGGAMMALAHDAKRVTEDVDSHIRTDTMTSHDTAALDAGQKERSADVVTGGRHEPAELVLGRLEARMAERGLRAHIYLTERSVVEFATRRKRTDRPLERNVGPEPVRRVLAELLPPDTEPRSWLRRLHAAAAGRSGVPAPTLWNSPALVVTGAMASRALCAALEHEPAYPAETIDCLMQEAETDENEAASMFEDVTGKSLKPTTAR